MEKQSNMKVGRVLAGPVILWGRGCFCLSPHVPGGRRAMCLLAICWMDTC